MDQSINEESVLCINTAARVLPESAYKIS